jgi:hypothetical protein
MGEQMFTMKNEVFVWPSVVSDGWFCSKVLAKEFVKDVTLLFHVNFHTFYMPFCTRLLQARLLQGGVWKSTGVRMISENGFDFDFFI